jgi:threonine dehydrogenase-like Zn-dependent dehydrogenase
MGGFCEFGIVRDGSAMAEDGDSSLADDYNVQRQLVMPPDLKPVEVALAISLAETASVLRHLPNLRGRTVAVTGAGTAGLAFMLWCKLAGARVVAIARREESLMEARAIAADLSLNTDGVADPAQSLVELAGGPVDGIIEATGAADLADALLPAISPEGFATAYGVPPTGASYNARWESPPVEEHLAMDWVCDMIRRKLIEPPRFYSHTWSLDEFEAAFAAVTARKVKKAFLRIAPDPL